MKIKIGPNSTRCQYIVDKDKRKVVCVIRNTKFLLNDFIEENFLGMYHYFMHDYTDKLLMPSTFSGVATCAPEDEWDEKLGKELAFARAKYKLDRSFFKRANWFVNKLDALVGEGYNEFNNYGEVLSTNHDRRLKKIREHLNDKDFTLYKNE